MAHDLTEPILLTAICKFAEDLLECDEILEKKKNMQPYFDVMDNFKQLIPYLGKEKYPLMLEMTRKYHNSTRVDQFRGNEAGEKEDTQLTHKKQDQGDETMDDEGDNLA